MDTTIYMVRHAESPYAHGQERTRGLSEEGLAAAVRVADYFDSIDIQYMVSSCYTRAVQTIQYIADRKSLSIEQYEELNERPIKDLDRKVSWDTLLEAIRESFVDKDYALEGGESTRAAQRRAIPVMETLLEQYEGQNVIVGTHGNIMTIIMNYYDESYGFDFWNTTSKPDIYKMVFNRNKLLHIERVWEG